MQSFDGVARADSWFLSPSVVLLMDEMMHTVSEGVAKFGKGLCKKRQTVLTRFGSFL